MPLGFRWSRQVVYCARPPVNAVGSAITGSGGTARSTPCRACRTGTDAGVVRARAASVCQVLAAEG